MGKVRRLIMILRCSHEVCAAFADTTHFQSSSVQTSRKSQSSHETWFGSSNTGPGVFNTSSLNARKSKSTRIKKRRNVFIFQPRMDTDYHGCRSEAIREVCGRY